MPQCVVDGCENQVFEQWRVTRNDCLGIDFDRGNRAVATGHDFDRAAAAGRFNRSGGELALDLFQLLPGARGLLHDFGHAGHGKY